MVHFHTKKKKTSGKNTHWSNFIGNLHHLTFVCFFLITHFDGKHQIVFIVCWPNALYCFVVRVFFFISLVEISIDFFLNVLSYRFQKTDFHIINNNTKWNGITFIKWIRLFRIFFLLRSKKFISRLNWSRLHINNVS